MSKSSPIIQAANLTKNFEVTGQDVTVLKNVSFEIMRNEFVVIYGPSGCGKSTLLHTVLGLEKPTSGTVKVLGVDVYQDLTQDQLADFRKEHVGMVYQQPNWVKAVNVFENVALPLTLLGREKDERIEKAHQLLASIKMEDWGLYHPAELSSGQQQKVALARALIAKPEIIIADEPTGNLDFESGRELMQLLRQLTEKSDKTVLMVTHDLEYLKYADRAIHLFDGQVKKIFSPAEDKVFMQGNNGNNSNNGLEKKAEYAQHLQD